MVKDFVEFPWIDLDKAYSYNAVFMYIVGERGVGKTFGCIKKGISNHLKSGDEFIYMRRTEKELKAAIPSFFEAIELKNIYPDHDFKTNGYVGYIAPRSTRDDKKREWTKLVQFVPLSRAQSFKSVNYSRVTTWIYDEFIREKSYGMYLPEEYRAFLNFYMTVDRNQNKTRVFLLGNSVSIMNPYFTGLNITAPENLPEFSRHGVGGLAMLWLTDSKAFKEAVADTPFAKFIAGTEFGEFANGNVFADSHNALVKKKPSAAVYRYTLETAKGTFSVWYHYVDNEFYLQKKRPSGDEVVLTMISANMTEDKRLVSTSSRLLELLRTSFNTGRAYFDNASTRNAFSEVFKR